MNVLFLTFIIQCFTFCVANLDTGAVPIVREDGSLLSKDTNRHDDKQTRAKKYSSSVQVPSAAPVYRNSKKYSKKYSPVEPPPTSNPSAATSRPTSKPTVATPEPTSKPTSKPTVATSKPTNKPVQAPSIAPVYTAPVATSKKYSKKYSPVQPPPTPKPSVGTSKPTSKPTVATTEPTAQVAPLASPTKYAKKYTKKGTSTPSPSVAPSGIIQTSIDSFYKDYTCGSLPGDINNVILSYVYNIDETKVSDVENSIRTVEGGLLQSMKENYVVCEASSTRRRLSAVAGVSAMPQDKISGTCGADCTSVSGGMTFYINNGNDLTGAKCDLRKMTDDAMYQLKASKPFITELAMVGNDEVNCDEIVPATPATSSNPVSASDGSVSGIEDTQSNPLIKGAQSGPKGGTVSTGGIVGLSLVLVLSVGIALFVARKYRKRPEEISIRILDDNGSDSVDYQKKSETQKQQTAPLIGTKEFAGENKETVEEPIYVEAKLITIKETTEEGENKEIEISIAKTAKEVKNKEEDEGSDSSFPEVVDTSDSEESTQEKENEEVEIAIKETMEEIKEEEEERLDSPFPEVVDTSDSITAGAMRGATNLFGMSDKYDDTKKDQHVRGSVGIQEMNAPPSRVQSMIPRFSKGSEQSVLLPPRINRIIEDEESETTSYLPESMLQQQGDSTQNSDKGKDKLRQVE